MYDKLLLMVKYNSRESLFVALFDYRSINRAITLMQSEKMIFYYTAHELGDKLLYY